MLKLDKWSSGIPEGLEVVGDGTGREHPGPEVRERPRRRRFSLEYKLRVLGEAGACKESGEVGALLLREGLYSSHPSAWRKQYQAGAFKGLKPSTDRVLLERITRLENENLRLREQLEEARVINEFPKKACEILGIPLKHHPSSADD